MTPGPSGETLFLISQINRLLPVDRHPGHLLILAKYLLWPLFPYVLPGLRSEINSKLFITRSWCLTAFVHERLEIGDSWEELHLVGKHAYALSYVSRTDDDHAVGPLPPLRHYEVRSTTHSLRPNYCQCGLDSLL